MASKPKVRDNLQTTAHLRHPQFNTQPCILRHVRRSDFPQLLERYSARNGVYEVALQIQKDERERIARVRETKERAEREREAGHSTQPVAPAFHINRRIFTNDPLNFHIETAGDKLFCFVFDHALEAMDHVEVHSLIKQLANEIRSTYPSRKDKNLEERLYQEVLRVRKEARGKAMRDRKEKEGKAGPSTHRVPPTVGEDRTLEQQAVKPTSSERR